MGRAPCCDKANVKKGPWSPEEDDKLKSYIHKHGTAGNWIALPQKIGLQRCGKSCRLRWLNYLRPNIKHGGFSEEEDNLICSLYISIGSRWSIIAAQLPGRTDNDIKNYWNTRLKKKLLGKQRKDHHSRRGSLMKRSGNGDNQNPYCPDMPVLAPNTIPYSTQPQEHRLTDHSSIRKLLIMLGGRFSQDDNQIFSPNPPLISSPTDLHQQQLLSYNDQHQFASMEGALINYTATSAQFGQTDAQFLNGGEGLQMLEGETISTFPGELIVREIDNHSNQEKLGGMEFLVGEEHHHMVMNNVINSGSTSAGESTISHSLDEISSLIYHPNYEVMQRLIMQESAFDNEFGLRH